MFLYSSLRDLSVCWGEIIRSWVAASVTGQSSRTPWSFVNLFEYSVSWRTTYVAFIQTAKPARSLSLRLEALSPGSLIFPSGKEILIMPSSHVHVDAGKKRLQNTCSAPQETAYSVSPLIASGCSEAGGVLTDFTAYKFQCLFSSPLRFAMIFERSKNKMPCSSHWKLTEVAEATPCWQSWSKDEVFLDPSQHIWVLTSSRPVRLWANDRHCEP